jgi:hypothetical protein
MMAKLTAPMLIALTQLHDLGHLLGVRTGTKAALVTRGLVDNPTHTADGHVLTTAGHEALATAGVLSEEPVTEDVEDATLAQEAEDEEDRAAYEDSLTAKVVPNRADKRRKVRDMVRDSRRQMRLRRTPKGTKPQAHLVQN